MKNNPLVSVLVHTRNSGRTIKQHLESICNQTYKPIEIIVVDNNSKDNTQLIAQKYTAHIFNYGPERSAQRNFAAKKSKGKFLLVPDSDMILGKNIVKECVEIIERNPEIKEVVIPEKSIGQGFWARCKALERSLYEGVDWIEAARFFDRKIFEEMGGYDEKNTGTEDYDLPQRIKRKFGDRSIGRIKDYIYHDEGNLSLLQTLRKKFYYAKSIHVYKKYNPIEFYKQANIIKRFLVFFANPKKLFKEPEVGLSMLFMRICEYTAGGLGYIFGKH